MDNNLKNQLVRSIFQFKRLVSTGFGIEMSNGDCNINLPELVLMSEISENTPESAGNVSITDVSAYLSVSKAAVSQMLSSLEKKGYIERETDKNNRRNVIVTLTADGRQVLAAQQENFSGKLGEIISRLGEDDVRRMIEIVQRMIDITQEINSSITDETNGKLHK